MPAYNNTTSPNSISRGDIANVWAAADGNLTSGTKTQRVAICPLPGGGARSIAMRVVFSGAPGTISLQPQASDFDNDADYVSEGSPITAVSATFEARVEFPTIAARFARLLATTVTNAVTASVDFAA